MQKQVYPEGLQSMEGQMLEQKKTKWRKVWEREAFMAWVQSPFFLHQTGGRSELGMKEWCEAWQMGDESGGWGFSFSLFFLPSYSILIVNIN